MTMINPGKPNQTTVTPGDLAKAYAVEWGSAVPTGDHRTLNQVNAPRILAVESWFQVPGQFNVILFGVAGYPRLPATSTEKTKRCW